MWLNGILAWGVAAGENVGGSVFLGSSLSADWISSGKTGLSYDLESGLLGGEWKRHIICIIGVIIKNW